MKKFFLLFPLLTICTVTYAQDVITQRNAEEIKAKVMKIDGSVIEYKKWDNPNGPVYVIPSRKVFTIQYENGSRDIIHAWDSKFRSNMDLGKYPRYQGEIAFAYGLGVGEVSNQFNTDRLVFETVHGIRINPYFFAGLGAAFNLFYTDMPAYNEEGEEFGTYTSAGSIPAFVNLKGYYPVSDKFSFYVSLDLGAAFGVSGYLKDSDTEFYTSIGPGVNFGKVGGFPRGDFSIRFQHMGKGANAVLFRIGFGF